MSMSRIPLCLLSIITEHIFLPFLLCHTTEMGEARSKMSEEEHKFGTSELVGRGVQ